MQEMNVRNLWGQDFSFQRPKWGNMNAYKCRIDGAIFSLFWGSGEGVEEGGREGGIRVIKIRTYGHDSVNKMQDSSSPRRCHLNAR